MSVSHPLFSVLSLRKSFSGINQCDNVFYHDRHGNIVKHFDYRDKRVTTSEVSDFIAGREVLDKKDTWYYNQGFSGLTIPPNSSGYEKAAYDLGVENKN